MDGRTERKLSTCIPARFVLPVVVAATHREVLFGPDDLGANLESRGFNANGNLRSMNARVSHVNDIAREQLVGGGPINLIVVCDPAGLTLLSRTGRLSPYRVIRDAIRRIAGH